MPETPATEARGIVAYQPSESASLAAALVRFGPNIHEAAVTSIMGTIGPDDGYTDTEIESMIAFEELRLINGMDLYAVLYRGKLIRDIEERALWSRHPNGFQNIEEAARSQGISASEYSNIRDLTMVIFPFMEETLQIPVAQVWESIGKSNFRELVPVLKAIITGEQPASASTRAAAGRILSETGEAMRATAESRGEEAPSAEAIRNQAISDLLLAGEQMTNHELRNHIRQGNRTRAIAPAVIHHGDSSFFVVKLDSDQLQALQRKLGGFMEDPLVANLPTEGRARATEAARIRVLRELDNLIHGA
jgi:hypothetical protein